MPVAQPGKKPPRRRRRPSWHKPLGLTVIALAVLVIFANDLALVGAQTPMPGGHSELYLFLGVFVGGLGSWLLGLFDPVR